MPNQTLKLVGKNGAPLELGPDTELREAVRELIEVQRRANELLASLDDTDRIRTVEKRTEVEKIADLPEHYPLPELQLVQLESAFSTAATRLIAAMPQPVAPVVEVAAPVVNVPAPAPFPKIVIPPFPSEVTVSNFPQSFRVDGTSDVRIKNAEVPVALTKASLKALAEAIASLVQPIAVMARGGGGGTADFATTNALIQQLVADLTSRYRTVTPFVTSFATTGDHDVVVPSAGKALEITYLYAQADSGIAGEVIATYKLGATPKYQFSLEASQPWAHSMAEERVVRGAVNEKLIVNLDSDKLVRINVETREFTP